MGAAEPFSGRQVALCTQRVIGEQLCPRSGIAHHVSAAQALGSLCVSGHLMPIEGHGGEACPHPPPHPYHPPSCRTC